MSLFASFYLGGFECSTHRLRSGRRLDLVAATQHDRFVVADYERLLRCGIRTVREGMRWHLIERGKGLYDFQSVRVILEAAAKTGMEVIWDLWHFGWPDTLDIFTSEFVLGFARFARAAAIEILKYRNEGWICPMNEISFYAWAGGEAGAFYPFAISRGDELKRQLVKASIAAIRAIRNVTDKCRFCHIDPVINVVPNSLSAADKEVAWHQHHAQFTACEMMLGRIAPELGGAPELIDVLGLNYYIHNQWSPAGRTISASDRNRRSLRDLLQENFQRFGMPIFIAETGIEGEARPYWFRTVCEEVRAAREVGVPVEAVCLYPVVNHPGWDDDRHIYNGLFDYADDRGRRDEYSPLLNELRAQQAKPFSDDGRRKLLHQFNQPCASFIA